MTNKEAIYEVWAPTGGLWSPWVKPVLFACMDQFIYPPITLMDWDATGLPLAEANVVLVLDLPEVQGVAAALALAARGYRPVPLYNAVPAPLHAPEPEYDDDDYDDDEDVSVTSIAGGLPILTAYPELGSVRSLVDVRPILVALWHATETLRAMSIRADAPPAFLLDARRHGDFSVFPGAFDNRSVSFTTDFPSANFLLGRGMKRAVLVQPAGDQPQLDLAHTLRNWQQAGMTIELKRLDTPGPPVSCEVAKPPRFRWIWQRALAAMGLRRARLGGFGSWVDMPGSGG